MADSISKEFEDSSTDMFDIDGPIFLEKKEASWTEDVGSVGHRLFKAHVQYRNISVSVKPSILVPSWMPATLVKGCY